MRRGEAISPNVAETDILLGKYLKKMKTSNVKLSLNTVVDNRDAKTWNLNIKSSVLKLCKPHVSNLSQFPFVLKYKLKLYISYFVKTRTSLSESGDLNQNSGDEEMNR